MKRILLFASAALLFAGCAKENLTPTENPDNNSQKGDITLSFSASQTGFGTKAEIGTTTGEGISKTTAIKWQSTDQISVFDGAKENCKFSTKGFNAETPTSCTFEGNVTAVANDYIAVYPYTEGATISDGVISRVTLPATQTAEAGSFDPSAALMAATTVAGGRDLAFKNLVGYVKVTTDFDCKQIELCAASKEALAGEGTITFTDGTPSFTLDQGAESTITLRPAGEGTLGAGKTYYIAVPATTLAAGWNISFTATDDKVYSRQGTKPILFKTNTVINLGTIYLNDFIPYVTFTAASEQTFNMYSNNFPLGETEYFEYSVGGGEWVKFREIIENIKFGGSHGNLRLRGKSSKGTSLSDDAYYGYAYSEIRFTTKNSPVDCTGDIRTLIDYENYANASTTDARFCKLFFGNEELRTAPSLPAQSLASRCYYAMFSGCTSLTTAPELPAETLADYCYDEMFLGCTKLTKAPKLPAKTLASYCYNKMFLGCTKLTTAPELPAETLADNCYNEMFSYCTKLTTVTSLPAYELAEYCYLYMFTGCESLTNLPKLPYFEKLSTGCFKGMFSGCKALATAPELHVIFSLAANCFESMFYGCTKLSSVKLFIHSEIDNKFNPHFYLSNWLNGAGTDKDVDSPQLYLGGGIYYYYGYLSEINSEYLNNDSYFPEKWRVQPLE